MPKDPSGPQTFGHYTLLEELGRGGQGTVWLAEDQKLKRRVALKLLRTGAGPIDEGQLARFHREAEAASKLDHPNICALFDAGEVDEVPYLAFGYIEGETLAGRIAPAEGHDDTTTKEGIQSTVALFEKLARALHHAHEKGLIHRDVKPGNIMITPDGEPIVLDFGLARDELADDQSLTHSGDLLGTPAYMSPEQLTAQRIPLDRRTDIYSLGATLYEALTRQRPYSALTRADLYQKILTSDPSSVSSVNHQVPRDLQVVVETAMEKDRNRRYQTALDLAEDLRRIREFEPIRARPVGRLLRVRRWTQRHPAVAVALMALLTTTIVVTGLLLNREAVLNRTRAIALALASDTQIASDQMEALLLALQAVDVEECLETRTSLYAAVAALRERREFEHEEAVKEALLSPQNDTIVTVSVDGWAKFWSLDGKPTLQPLNSESGVHAVAFSPGGELMLTCCHDGVARVWDWRQGRLVNRLSHGTRPLREALFVDSERVVTRGDDTAVHLWSVRGVSGQPITSFAHSERIRDVAFSARRQELLTGSNDKTARRWSLDGTDLQEYPHPDRVLSVDFAEDGASFVTGARDGFARRWSIDGGPPVLHQGLGGVRAKLSPDEQSLLAISFHDTAARVWDADGHEAQLRGHGDTVLAGLFTPDSHHVVTGSADQTARIFTTAGKPIGVLSGHEGGVTRVRVTPDGKSILSAGEDGTARLWDFDPGGGQILRTTDGDPVMAARFLPHQQGIALGTRSGRLEVWDGNGRLQSVHSHKSTVRDLSISRDGKKIIVLHHVGARLWSLEPTLTLLHEFPSRLDSSNWCDLSATEEWFTVGGSPGVVIFNRSGERWDAWDEVDTWKPTGTTIPGSHFVVARFVGHQSLLLGVGDTLDLCPLDKKGLTAALRMEMGEHGRNMTNMHVSRDGRLLLSAGSDSTVCLWSLDASDFGTRVGRLVGHEGVVWGGDFSPDPESQLILTGGADGTARLWNRETGEQLAILRGHESEVRVVRFSPEGDRVLTAGSDGTVRVWYAKFEDLHDYAKSRRFRGFKESELDRHKHLLRRQ